MFSKKSHGDFKKSGQKVLDLKKDVLSRLRHLRVVIENAETTELKSYFEQYFSHIYHVFYENFILLESSTKQRVHKAQREDLDAILAVFEKIFLFLPELIHSRWQFHSIGRIMKKLLHVGNGLKHRMDGMRLFLLWFQILQENASEECYLMYATLVPGFPVPTGIYGSSLEHVMTHNSKTSPNNDSPILEVEINPIVPAQPGEKPTENLTKLLLESLLKYTVTQVPRVEWSDSNMKDEAFIFLLENFKRFYLPHIFPEFLHSTSLYSPILEIPQARSTGNSIGSSYTNNLAACRVSVVNWVVSFIATHKTGSKSGFLNDKPELNTKDSLERKLDILLKEGGDSSNSSSATISPNSTLSLSTSTISLAVPLQDDLESSGRELVQRVLYSTRDNINFVQEVLRQGFLLPMSESKAVKLSLKVYNEWIQNSMVKPVFMEEPEEDEGGGENSETKRLEPTSSLTNQISSILEASHEGGPSQEGGGGGVTEMDSPSYDTADKTFAGYLPDAENETRGPPLVKSPSVSSDGTKAKRSNSYIGAINQAIRDDMDKCNVGAGLQKVVQVFITNSSNVFLLEPGGGASGAPDPTRPIRDQVDICRRVLGSYRHIVMNVKLEKTTWEQLLMVLLRVTEGILGGTPSKPRLALGQQLAHILFQTLIVTWIKANLEIQVSTSLWEDFLRVLSSLTHWEELIKEWSRTMETLTRVLARRVYHLDLSNLPLDKLSEQKQKRLRGGGRQPPPLQADLMKRSMHERSFSRGWSRCDSTSPNSMEELERKRNKMNTIGSQSDLSRIREMRQSEKDGDVISLHSSHPNLTRQRSLTVDPSLAAREDVPLVSSAQIPRSSSEGELFDGFNFQRNKEDGDREGMVKSTTFPLVSRQHHSSENGQNNKILDELSLSQSSIPLISHPDTLSLDDTSLEVPLPDSIHTTPTDINRLTPTSSLIEEIDQEVIALSPGVHYQSDGSGSGTPIAGAVHTNHSGDSGSVTPVSGTPHFGYGGTSPGGLRFCNSDDTSPGGHNHYNLDGSSRDTPLIGVLNDNGDMVDLAKESPLMEEEEDQNIHIEDRMDLANERTDSGLIGNHESIQSPDASVMSGGTRIGWHPDVAVVVWRRLLCILGDINQISDPRLHWVVLECLWDIWQMLAKIRDNQGISTDNQTTPPPPENIPPLLLFSPWLFRATYLPVGYQHGRLSAYKQLCAMTVRRQDHPLPKEHLVHFYRVLHFGLVGTDQDVINTIVQYSAPEFFFCDLPGATLLILDFIQAANMITATCDLDAPRIEALSLLGSLVCLPNMFCNLTVFQPSPKEISTMVCKDIKPVKDHLITILLKCGKKEPNCEARCIALCGLGIFVYEELVHTTFHPRIKEAINVLLASLKFQNKLVGQVACDMLLVICDHAERLRRHLPEAPKKIIEVIAMTIASLLSSTEMTEQEEDKKLIVSLMFCLSEWCISIPLASLLEGTESKSKKEAKPLIQTVFKVLQTAVEGVPAESPLTINFSELASPDYDPHINLDSLNDGQLLHPALKNTPMEFSDYIFDEGVTQASYQVQPSFSSELTRLTARTVLRHLIDKLNHFPLGGGPACVTSLINEVDDLPTFDTDDITPRLFESENVQFFIYNDAALISLIQIPPLDDGSESKLSLATSDLRAVVRNVSGKFAWDGRIIYGPADCKAQPTRLVTREKPPVAPPPEDQGDSVFWMAPKSRKLSVDIITNNKKSSRSTVPSWQEEGDSLDVLNELQQYIGFTSPECLLRPGIPLNLPFPSPADMCTDMERYAMGALLKQCDKEAEYVERYGEVESMVAEECWQTAHKDPESQFFLCRQLFSQLGMMNWDKRDEIDIVKKNEQFARELKNLDSRQCRETHKIAVLYVAEGQEDKQSVLSNSGGSKAYENFISGLGWEVDLGTHPGFMGGLHKNRSTGDTAPYYATSTVEVIFHVSTRMPSGTDLNKKMRHLGNDEVHIVWSEHSRDYRRGIIATEFGDVIIVIYPLKNQLFRIQIQRKGDVPFFGPLFDGAVVDYRVLPGLVRATAINANRIKRSQLEFYQQFYEERAKYLDTIVKNHKDCSTFEDYSAHVFEPALARQKIQNTRYFTSPESSGSGPAHSLTGVDSKSSLLPTKLQLTSKSTEKPHQASPSSSMARPNRFSQPERLMASMTQEKTPLSLSSSLSSSLTSSVKVSGNLGNGGERHSPRLGGRKEGRGDEKTPSSEVPGISTQTDLTASSSTNSTASTSSGINPARPRSRTKRQSSSGSANSEPTPPESPENNKK